MLKIRSLAASIAASAVIANMLVTPVAAVVREASKDTFFEGLDPNSNVASLNIENYYASYDSITFTSKRGGTSKLYLSGNSIGVDTNCGSGMRINVTNERNSIVTTGAGDTSFTFDTGNNIEVNQLYYIMFLVTADGLQSRYDGIAITKKADGNLAFVKSMCYDFNVERCSELWTDDQSLEECLQPQNDSECDAGLVEATAQRLTAGCSDDWAKVFAIYEYMINDFAYDYVQVDDSYYIYQDDASCLIRRKIAICEGLGNTFTALCRAAGVPAAVSFGIGGSTQDFVLSNNYTGDEGCNHAWAVVCIDGTWYHMDPTWDGGNSYTGNSYNTGTWNDGNPSYNFYLLPLEYFSLSHKICDADTIHGRAETGSCGDHATYEITRDGTITIHGSGTLQLPYGCNGFRFLVFADDCTIDTIGEECFADCDVLRTVILPDTVTHIEDYAFNTCEDLEYIYLPEGLQSIGDCAFDYCDELAYVYIPDSVTDVGQWAFDDCPRAIISVPGGVDLEESDYYVSPYRIIERAR
ncbi:MAG: leucine-rich repeat protein [Clostridiales bacterium]|nr:leucine-rich repeat protein [Clostridiales bacterium]